MRMRRFADVFARRSMRLSAAVPGFIALLILLGLVGKSRTILGLKSFGALLFGSGWHPLKGEFGFWPFISGTLWVTFVAMVLAVPISLLTAIYLSEYAPRSIRELAKPVIDLLAGIPSVVYGVWGVLIIVPFVGNVLAPAFGAASSGYSVLAAGIVLAVMVFPTIIHVSLEVFASVPHDLRDASLALGATTWETVKHVVLRKGIGGIFAAVVLGLSRAFGETMAVLMVVGNVARPPRSVFDPGYTLPALLANNYGEMMSIPLYDSALMLAALVLFGVVLVFNIGARLFLVRIERRAE
jgi:phosphate transport system permease protein